MPIETDALSPVGFRLVINSTEFSQLQYHCFAASLPSVSLPGAVANFRKYGQSFTGDRLEYDPLTVRFIVDAQALNYQEIFRWIQSSVDVNQPQFKDVELHILTPQNNVAQRIRFVSAFPVSLDALDFNAQTADVEYLTCDVSLVYTRFEFLPL